MPALVLAAAHALEQRGEIVGVLLFLGEDFLQHAPGGGILLAEVVDHLAVAVDGDALGDQVFLDHVLQRVAFDVLGVAARGEALGREVGRAAELRDALGDLVGVLLLLLGVLEKFRRHALRVDALRHEVMALVAQRADDLGGERLVQELQHHAAVGVVAGSHRPFGDVLPGTPAQRLDVGEERSPAGLGLSHYRLASLRLAPVLALRSRLESDLACFALMSAFSLSYSAFACFLQSWTPSLLDSHFSLAISYLPSAFTSSTLRAWRSEGSYFCSSSALAVFSFAL